MAPELALIAAALKSMKRANSGLTWIRQNHVSAFLAELAAAPAVTHEQLDQLPASRTREYVRGLLVEHGALPYRDELATRFQHWAAKALGRLTADQNRDVIGRYIRWHHQRRMNTMTQVTQGTFLRAKQTVTVAIDFLNWLHKQGIELNELEQAHLDAWQAEGPTTRGVVDQFLRWAIKSHIIDPRLTTTRHRRGTSPRLSATAQDQIVQRVVHTNEFDTRDRAAAILVIVFGQQIEHVVRLTWRDVIITEDVVTIRLGSIEIALPSPLDEPWRDLARSPGNDQTAAHPNSNWVFRGYSPGRHLHPASLRKRLQAVFSTRAARLGTLHELSKLAPVAIVAEVLGYHPSTIERHAIASSTTYAQYVAAVRESDGERP